MPYFPKFSRRLLILLIAQAVAGASVPVLFLISGLLGPKLSPTLKLSTLPMSLVVIGVALTSPLASWTMSKLGRKEGHIAGLFFTLLGVATAGLGLSGPSFLVYSAGCFITGAGSAFNNQIRFTAAEAAGDQKALVHSWVLMFSLFAAILGPWMVSHGHLMLPQGEYTGSIVMLFTALSAIFVLLFALPKSSPHLNASKRSGGQSKAQIFRQAKFWIGALCGLSSFATMTLLMSATPLQMHEMEHFSSSETTMTLQSHIVAMYLPSLFSGLLLSWLGIRRLIGLGASLFLICIGLAYSSTSFHHYWWALVILGIGWNFLFLAGSTWISQSFSGPDAFVAQGANDTLVYGTQSIASLAAGWLLFEVGWKTLVLIPVPLLLGLLFFVFGREREVSLKKLESRRASS